jgi:hypothetical protein
MLRNVYSSDSKMAKALQSFWLLLAVMVDQAFERDGGTGGDDVVVAVAVSSVTTASFALTFRPFVALPLPDGAALLRFGIAVWWCTTMLIEQIGHVQYR